MSFKQLKRSLINNFLASADIKVFGRTYLFTMLLLIGLTLFYTQGVFVLFVRVIAYFHEYDWLCHLATFINRLRFCFHNVRLHVYITKMLI